MLFLLCLVGVASAGEFSVALSPRRGKVPVALAPEAEREWAIGERLVIGGAYSYADTKFGPKGVTVALKESIGPVPLSVKLGLAKPLTTDPRKNMPALTVTAGDLAKGQPKIVLDAENWKPKLLAARFSKVKGLTLEPSWRPRQLASESKGLQLDVGLQLNGDRATLSSTLALHTRAKLAFAFVLDDATTLRLEPLLGPESAQTRYSLEREAEIQGQKCKFTASCLQRKLSLGAKFPGFLGSSLKPTLVVPFDTPSKTTFKISQHFKI